MDDATAVDVRIVADGDFGVVVAEHLRSLLAMAGRPARVAREPALEFAAGGGFGVRASWRDLPVEFEAFAEAARPAPWLPIAMASPYIRVGPVFVHGRAPCHTCYRSRVRQHESLVEEEIRGRLAVNPRLGVRGFSPHHCMIAAGLALALMDGGEHGAVAAVDCRTDEVTPWRVVPAERCPGCDEGAGR
ncbi:TOMM precursor leader peptide-binding protein [Sphaerisporangium dianthi]|uniref:TOMM leader peptide-binding protein n=1 Tax=Sphaerisporangium dianthi TaxID=1436120 RepID=A0ABV9CDV6_9ACTN